MGDKIAIMGPGAVGSFVGAHFVREGEDVTFIDMWPEHVETMRSKGLRASSVYDDFTVPVNAMHLTDAQNIQDLFDIAFITVKSYDTEWATHFIKRYVKPDGFFTIQHRGQLHHFFLEADRSTMTNTRYFAKLRAYWLWWKQGGHQRTLNIANFRVLTLTISEKRNQNLRALAKQADDRKQGTTMFLFACEKSFSLEDPATILKPVWQTPVGDRWHTILG